MSIIASHRNPKLASIQYETHHVNRVYLGGNLNPFSRGGWGRVGCFYENRDRQSLNNIIWLTHHLLLSNDGRWPFNNIIYMYVQILYFPQEISTETVRSMYLQFHKLVRTISPPSCMSKGFFFF